MLRLPEKGGCFRYTVVAAKLYLRCVLTDALYGVADRVIIKIIYKAAVFICIGGKQLLIIVLQSA